MNRRGFVGVALAGIGGFFFPQKLEASSKCNEITQYDLGTDHITIRYEVLSKFLRPYRYNTKAVWFPSHGWMSMWKADRFRGSVQETYEGMIKASSQKYLYILHNSKENLWGFFSSEMIGL